MEFPDDVLSVIRKFSRPYRTRRDWRECKRFEAWKIEQYFACGRFLLNKLSWYNVTDEYGIRLFYNKADVAQHLRETNMINRILEFEANMPFEMDRMDLMYVWFDHNWAPGIAALPR